MGLPDAGIIVLQEWHRVLRVLLRVILAEVFLLEQIDKHILEGQIQSLQGEQTSSSGRTGVQAV